MKYTIEIMSSFKKSYKKIKKQNKDLEKIHEVINLLAEGKKLDYKYKDHQLIDDKYYKNCRECHITPDWLLIYRHDNEKLILILIDTGSHSELFNIWKIKWIKIDDSFLYYKVDYISFDLFLSKQLIKSK